MKTWAAFTVLLVLGTVPTRAGEKDKAATLRGEIEFLELQRDVDKTLLREAMLLAGRGEMQAMADPLNAEEARKQSKVERDALEKFIEGKREAVIERTSELKRKASELAAMEKLEEKSAASRRVSQPNRIARTSDTPGDDKERQELIEKMEEAQVEVQLLQMQTQLYQQPLSEALRALANAEFAASNDKTQQDKADAARKRFEKSREKYVNFSKKLQLEQSKLNGLQMRSGMGGMGGGMR